MHSVLVIGDNPDDLMEKYRADREVEKYVKYKFEDAEHIRKTTLETYRLLLEQDKFSMNNHYKDLFNSRKTEIESMSTFDFFMQITEGMEIDDNGYAWTTENPDGKWLKCQLGGTYVVPFSLLNGTSTYQSIKGEIDWKAMHLNRSDLYSRTWDIIKNGDEPKTEQDERILSHQNALKPMLEQFQTKEDYVVYNTSYWTYAVLTEDGWVDADDDVDALTWIRDFFDKFIVSLNPNTKLTIYEFQKK